jgi:hypothetical protein
MCDPLRTKVLRDDGGITKTRSAGPRFRAAANVQRQCVILSRLSYRIKVACHGYPAISIYLCRNSSPPPWTEAPT